MITDDVCIQAGDAMNQPLADQFFKRTIDLHWCLDASKVTCLEQLQNIVSRLWSAACLKRLQHLCVVLAEFTHKFFPIEDTML